MKYTLFFCFTFCIFYQLDLNGQAYKNFKQTGIASYFVDKYDGRKTVSGEVFRNDYYVGSHKTLPFHTMVQVTNLENDKSVVVRIIDRGPYAHGRIIDVSKAAAEKIDLIRLGSTKVEIAVVGENGKLYEDEEKEKDKENEEESLTENNETNVKPSEDKIFKVGRTFTQWGTERSPQGYGLQVGVFSGLENAKETCTELVEKGIQKSYYTYIQVGWNDDKDIPIYRVLVGEFEYQSGEAIKNAQRRLSSVGYESLVKPHFKD